MNQWMDFLTTQWWLFALLGGAAVLAFLIRGKSDEEAVKLLSNKLWGAGAAFVAWYAFQFIGTQPFFGLGVGAGATFAVLSLLLGDELKHEVVKSEQFGKLTIAVLTVGGFVFFIMPTLTPSQLSNLLLGVAVIGAIYAWTQREKWMKKKETIKVEKPEESKKDDVVKADIIKNEPETPTVTTQSQSTKKS